MTSSRKQCSLKKHFTLVKTKMWQVKQAFCSGRLISQSIFRLDILTYHKEKTLTFLTIPVPSLSIKLRSFLIFRMQAEIPVPLDGCGKASRQQDVKHPNQRISTHLPSG